MYKKTLLATVAAAALMAPVAPMAMAQTNTPATTDTMSSSKVEFLAKQKADEHFASDMMGVTVQNFHRRQCR